MNLKNLNPPAGKVDVILDTDTYNEIDDQFAVSYLLKYSDRLNCVGLTAAPFLNERSTSPEDGMEKSYNEILKLLGLIGKTVPVFRGSKAYLSDESTPAESPAARFIAETSQKYSSENPLYIVGIGAVTNVASAILMAPEIIDKIVIVWLGGSARHINNTMEFNMYQDIFAARVVMGCGAPFVQLPCCGVVDAFYTFESELRDWLIGKTPLSTYLAENTIKYSNPNGEKKIWTKVIWDVTAIAWLVNDQNDFLEYDILDTYLPGFDGHYETEPLSQKMCYVKHICRDKLMEDLFKKITE